jgi:hypothetical protein
MRRDNTEASKDKPLIENTIVRQNVTKSYIRQISNDVTVCQKNVSSKQLVTTYSFNSVHKIK